MTSIMVFKIYKNNSKQKKKNYEQKKWASTEIWRPLCPLTSCWDSASIWATSARSVMRQKLKFSAIGRNSAEHKKTHKGEAESARKKDQ